MLEPADARREEAGRVAAQPGPRSEARVLANMVGAHRHWVSAVGYALAGNPAPLDEAGTRRNCRAIEGELSQWARGERDPVAGRHARGST